MRTHQARAEGDISKDQFARVLPYDLLWGKQNRLRLVVIIATRKFQGHLVSQEHCCLFLRHRIG